MKVGIGVSSVWAFLDKFGSAGTGDSQFGLNAGNIVLDSNYLYVMDTSNSRLQVFSKISPYTLVWKFGSSGSGNSNLSIPGHVAVDATYAYIADRGNGKVKLVNLNTHVYVDKFSGALLGGQTQLYGIAVDDNYIYASGGDGTTRTINIYAKTTPYAVVGSFTLPYSSSTVSIKVDSNYIYTISQGSNEIRVYDKNSPYSLITTLSVADVGDMSISTNFFFAAVGNSVSNSYVKQLTNALSYELKSTIGTTGTGDGQFSFVNGRSACAIDSSLLYIIDSGNRRVQIFQAPDNIIGSSVVIGGQSERGGVGTAESLLAVYALTKMLE